MWQGILKAWSSIQSGLEQQDSSSWDEISGQPICGNRLLTNELGIQWGTQLKSNLKYWLEQGIKTIKDIAREDGSGWRSFAEQKKLHRSKVAPALYEKIIRSIPWPPAPAIPNMLGLWIAEKDETCVIQQVYHITKLEPTEATRYHKKSTEQLQLM